MKQKFETYIANWEFSVKCAAGQNRTYICFQYPSTHQWTTDQEYLTYTLFTQTARKTKFKSETFISTCLICYFNCIKVINIVYSKMQWSAMYWAYVKYIIGGYALITGQKLDWTSPYIITAGFKLEVCVGHYLGGKQGITMLSNGNNGITKPGKMSFGQNVSNICACLLKEPVASFRKEIDNFAASAFSSLEKKKFPPPEGKQFWENYWLVCRQGKSFFQPECIAFIRNWVNLPRDGWIQLFSDKLNEFGPKISVSGNLIWEEENSGSCILRGSLP